MLLASRMLICLLSQDNTLNVVRSTGSWFGAYLLLAGPVRIIYPKFCSSVVYAVCSCNCFFKDHQRDQHIESKIPLYSRATATNNVF